MSSYDAQQRGTPRSNAKTYGGRGARRITVRDMTTLPTTTVGLGGWVRLLDERVGGPAYVRFRASSKGALEPHQIYVDVDPAEGISLADAVRAVPLDRLTVWANSVEARGEILEDLHQPAPDPATAVRFFNWREFHTYMDEGGNDTSNHWVAQMFDQQRCEEPPPTPPQEERGPRQQRKALAKLRKLPAGRRYPDEFYRDVARVYMTIVWRSDSPAVDIATANGVEPSTVRGWIAGARKRGFLTKEPGQGRRVG